MVFLVAALVTMPPIVAPSLHQPVPATVHGLGGHVSVAARDAEAQRSTVFERQRRLLFGATERGMHRRKQIFGRGFQMPAESVSR